MSTENKNRVLKKMSDMGHKMPVTRREFMAAGLAQSLGMIFLPTVSSLITSTEASAAEISPAFFVFDCVGGLGTTRSVVMGADGGPIKSPLNSYDKLGMSSTPTTSQINTNYGIAFLNNGAFINGLHEGLTSTAAREKLFGFSIACATIDDSPANPLSMTNLLTPTIVGDQITSPIGTRASSNGGYSASPIRGTAGCHKPVLAPDLTSVINATRLGGALSMVSSASKSSWAKAAKALAKAQANLFSNRAGGKRFSELNDAAYSKLGDFVSGAISGDPRTDSLYQSLFNLTPTGGTSTASPADRERYLVAALAFNVFNQNAPGAVLSMNGFDYHVGGFDQLDVNANLAKDRQLFKYIGLVIECAHRAGRPTFIQVITDGGNSWTTGTNQPAGDGGDRSATLCLYFNPKGPKKIRTDGVAQIGAYDPVSQTVAPSVIREPAHVAYAAAANFFSTMGPDSLKAFMERAGRPFSDQDLNERILLLGKS